ncbi:programmed cell death protein 2-like isoform X2 [Anneissia japonica]|uniref:programmed cell death protein 2-like isoform X2 n=1 Tax=Anneissia japonica TaxID=1529436 RepID=UPI001425AC31|nr:programmed cell death protein 2-like isoform X2 [Anneissia japonica]
MTALEIKMAAPMRVLVGVKDEVLNGTNSNFLTNKIGGNPDWIHGGKQKNPACKLCGKILYLAVQVYCPLEGSKYHRTLYIFACANRSCWNKQESWDILRSQKVAAPKSKKAETKVDEVVLATSDWCNDADDWGCDGDNNDCTDLSLQAERFCDKEGYNGGNKLEISEQSNVCEQGVTGDFTSQMLDLRLHDDLVVQAEATDEFLSFYINVFEEPTEHTHTAHELRLVKEYEKREGLDFMDWHDNSSNKGYCWGGTPLYIRNPQQTSLDKAQEPCKYCGSKMTFELQLMPSLVRLLQDQSNPDKTVEFGVILVYTCSKSCWQEDDDASCRNEVVIIQPDPDQDLFKVF